MPSPLVSPRSNRNVYRRPPVRHVPLGVVDPADALRVPCDGRPVECPECLKNFAGGAVFCSPANFSEKLFRYFVTRALYCDHCNHLVMWDQTSDSLGERLGPVISVKPLIIKEQKVIDDYLEAHPEMKGVLQA